MKMTCVGVFAPFHSALMMALEFALDCFCFFLQLLQLSHLMSKTNDMTAGPLPASDLNHTSTIPDLC